MKLKTRVETEGERRGDYSGMLMKKISPKPNVELEAAFMPSPAFPVAVSPVCEPPFCVAVPDAVVEDDDDSGQAVPLYVPTRIPP